MTKKIISAVIAACMVFGSASLLPEGAFTQDTAITASAEIYKVYGDFLYSTVWSNGSAVEITGYTGTAKQVTVPASIGGLTVTKIGRSCFAYNQSIESVKLRALSQR